MHIVTRMSYLRPIAWACLAAAFAAPAAAEPGDAIGAAVTVVNHVTGEFNRNLRNLETGDDVRQEEIIAVAEDSLGELMLRDQTKVALGPGARLTLDRFIYDPNRSGGSIVLNLVKGGFRFITGIAAKPVYSIRTPVASITVRGTVFDVYIEGQEAIWILLHEGAITVCNNAGKCRELNDPCRLMRIGAGGDMPEPGTWNALPYARSISFDTAFPFVVKPPGIDPKPVFSREDIELGRCPEPKVRKADYEPDETPAKPKKATPRRQRQTYVRPRYRRSPQYTPTIPNITLGIGIGGGGRRGGGHQY
jgi:hypothetical protein